ncbi:MAG: phosphoesterase [Parcubacteria group bacterium]|nr:phosphoesterase [Parcubacteria group bacterium]
MLKAHSKHTQPNHFWLICAFLSGIAFVAMLLLARFSPDTLDDFDALVTPHITWLQSFASVQVFIGITTLGSVLGVALIALGALYFLRRSRSSIVRLIVLLAGAGLSVDLAKNFVERVRPEVLTWLIPESSFSFPSGHSTLAMAFYGFVAVSLYRRANSVFARTAAIIIPALIVLLVGFSRMVLNYHYFTDVVAGFLLGFFWLSIVLSLPRSVTNLGK